MKVVNWEALAAAAGGRSVDELRCDEVEQDGRIIRFTLRSLTQVTVQLETFEESEILYAAILAYAKSKGGAGGAGELVDDEVEILDPEELDPELEAALDYMEAHPDEPIPFVLAPR